DQQKVDFTLANFRTTLRLPLSTTTKPFDQTFELLTIASFLKKIGYVGALDNLTQFKVKKLPQPWQTLFKVLNLPKRFVEPYHYVYNDDPVAKMFATGAKVQEDYVEEYGRLDFLIIQPSSVAFTQWTHRTLRAPSNTTQDLIVYRIDIQILVEQDELMDEGEYVEANMFVDDMVLSQPILDTSLETWNEKMQTPIPTPPRSFRNDLSLDKATFVELTESRYYLRIRMSYLPGILKKINDALHVAVLKISIDATNDHLRDNILRIISQDLATRVPKVIEELLKQHMESTTSNVRSSSKTLITSISDLQCQLYMNMRQNVQSQIDDSVIWEGLQDNFGMSLVLPSTCRPHASCHRDQDDHPDDNPEGEKNSKKQKSTFDSSSTNVHEINDGVNKSKEADTKVIAEIQGTKWVPTIADFGKIKFAHNNIMKSQCKTGAECEYHLQQIDNFMNNQVVWESKQPDIPQ
nr:hypothetical protein [Tanacetum cinerariifolium]